jgi:hypothetical protein
LLSSYAEYFGSLWDFPSTTSIHPNRSNILAVKMSLAKMRLKILATPHLHMQDFKNLQPTSSEVL